MTVEQRTVEVLKTIADEIGKAIVSETPLDEMGLDSLDYLDLILKLEERFNLKIPNQQMAAFQTAGHIAAYLGTHADV
jgi:acyl carrier protein